MKKEKILYAANVLQFPKYVRNTEPEPESGKQKAESSKTDKIKSFMSKGEKEKILAKVNDLHEKSIQLAMEDPCLWPITLETVMGYHHPTDDYIDDRYRTFLKQTQNYEREIVPFLLCEERKGTDIPRTKKGREHYLAFWREFYDNLDYFPDDESDGFYIEGVPAVITIVIGCMHQENMDTIMDDNRTRKYDRKTVMAINRLCNYYVDERKVCVIWMQNFYAIEPRIYDTKEDEKKLRKEFSEIFKYCLYRGGAVYIGYSVEWEESRLHIHCYEFDEIKHNYKKVTPGRTKEFAPDALYESFPKLELVFD